MFSIGFVGEEIVLNKGHLYPFSMYFAGYLSMSVYDSSGCFWVFNWIIPLFHQGFIFGARFKIVVQVFGIK